MGPIGVFDSGYGGLTVLSSITKRLPGYDYVYLGDNARTPYGPRSYQTIYEYTLECVRYLFGIGCPLIILACNTASAKALRTIQQNDLPRMGGRKRVLGVIRPTTELIGNISNTGYIGVLGTSGTVNSRSYEIEINKFFPEVKVFQQACPMWVPLVECGEHTSPGADYFVCQYLDQLLRQEQRIDTLLLGCTHYPLLIRKIKDHVPEHISIIDQGGIVAPSLEDYLSRHPEIEAECKKGGGVRFLTTDSPEAFDKQGNVFYHGLVQSEQVHL